MHSRYYYMSRTQCYNYGVSICRAVLDDTLQLTHYNDMKASEETWLKTLSISAE